MAAEEDQPSLPIEEGTMPLGMNPEEYQKFLLSLWESSTDHIYLKERIIKDSDTEGEEMTESTIIPGKYFTSPVWKDEIMSGLLDTMEQAKCYRAALDSRQFNAHSKNMNPTNFIETHLKARFDIELCSETWCKMYEILSTNSLLSTNNMEKGKSSKLNTIHICESGAMVAALNQFLKTNHPNLDWQWMATRLSPFHEGNVTSPSFEDDEFLKATFKNWSFLENNTGNIICMENLAKLEAGVRRRFGDSGGIQLVTGDGTLVYNKVTEERESRVSQIQLAQIVAALNVLEIGPKRHGRRIALFGQKDIPLAFMKRLQEAADYFTTFQVGAIYRNINNFHRPFDFYPSIKHKQREIALDWISRFNIQDIDPALHLSPKTTKYKFEIPPDFWPFEHKLGFFGLKCIGRKVRMRLSLFQNCMDLKEFIMPLDGFYQLRRIKFGKPYLDIVSSPFCNSLILIWRNQFRSILLNWRDCITLEEGKANCNFEEKKAGLESSLKALQGDNPLNLQVICCHDTLESLTHTTDSDKIRRDLVQILNIMMTMKEGGSLFLCEFQLLSRLQFGFILGISDYFEYSTIYVHKEKNIRGIVLHGYEGWFTKSLRSLSLTTLMEYLSSTEKWKRPLECVSMSDILKMKDKDMDKIKTYNIINTGKSLQDMADKLAQMRGNGWPKRL